MDEFADGYMKFHTMSTGKRRWSRKISLLQNPSKEDLEKPRMKMDTVTGVGNDKNVRENETNDKKDDKIPTSLSSTTTAANYQDKEKKDSTDENDEKPKADFIWR